jgi:hypothetical protein
VEQQEFYTQLINNLGGANSGQLVGELWNIGGQPPTIPNHGQATFQYTGMLL